MFGICLAAMGSVLWSATGAAEPTPTFPTPAEMAEARALIEREAVERRAVLNRAVERSLLGSGYFQVVEDPDEIAIVRGHMQERLQDLGIAAKIGQCDWMGLLAVGTANGNLSYGAACKIGIGGRPQRSLQLCSSRYGGLTLVERETYGSDEDDIELFIRRACF